MSWSICWRFAGIGADKHPLDSQCKPLSVELPGTLLAGAPAPVGQLSHQGAVVFQQKFPRSLGLPLCARNPGSALLARCPRDGLEWICVSNMLCCVIRTGAV